MKRIFLFGMAACVAVFGACGDSEDSTSTEGTMVQTGTPTAGGGGSGGGVNANCPDSGMCVEMSCMQGETACTWDCSELASPCDEALFTGFGMTLARPYTLMNMDAADCIFQSLREGKPGVYRWRVVDETGNFYQSRELNYLDGRVGNYEATFNDSGGFRSERSGPATVEDAAFFTGCQSENAADDIWDCLEDWQLSCGTVSGTGGAGGS